MKEELFEKYWTNFGIWLIILCITVVIFVLLIVFKNRLLSDNSDLSRTKYIRVIVFIVLSVSIVFSSIKFSHLYRDLTLVLSEDCEVFIGEFVNYTRYVESNDPGYPRGSNPMFYDNDTNEEIVISGTQEYEVGETYIIYYLPRSMIFVIEKISVNSD
jgi:hypothetical protein